MSNRRKNQEVLFYLILKVQLYIISLYLIIIVMPPVPTVNDVAKNFSYEVAYNLFAWSSEDEERVFLLAQDFGISIADLVEGIRVVFDIERGYYVPGTFSFLEIFHRYLEVLGLDMVAQMEQKHSSVLYEKFHFMLEKVKIQDDSITFYLDDEEDFWTAWKGASEEEKASIDGNKILKYLKDFMVTKESDF